MKTQITEQLKLPFLFVQKFAQVVRSALSRLSRSTRRFISRPICTVLGCDHRSLFFSVNELSFCRRCGCEIAGRSVDDLEPLPADMWEGDYWR